MVDKCYSQHKYYLYFLASEHIDDLIPANYAPMGIREQMLHKAEPYSNTQKIIINTLKISGCSNH